MEVSDQPHAAAALPPRKNSDTDWTGRGTGPVGGLDHSFSIDGRDVNFGGEAFLSGLRNIFMNLFITNSHYLDNCMKSIILGKYNQL